MRQRLQRHTVALLCVAVLVLSWTSSGSIDAQSAAAGKRPLSYDAYDAWWSIQGTTLSRDGEWLAYALTAQGLDGQLVVRNLRTGQELKHARGTNPSFTPDGKFVVFTIAQTKAGVDGEGRALSRSRQTGCDRHVQAEGRDVHDDESGQVG